MTVTAAIVLAVLGFLGWQQFSAQGAASNQRVVVAGADGMPLEQGLGDGQDSPLPGDASGSGNSGDNSVLTGDATTDGGASHKVRTDAADGTDPETPSDVKTGDTVDPDSGDTVDPGSGTDNGQDASPDKAEPDSHFVLGKLPPWDFGGDYRDFAISPDGKMLVVGSDTKLIGLHATSGDILWERILSRGSCYGVDFTQDSKRVVVAGPNSKVRLYSAADGAFLTDAENSGYSMGAASSSDGKFVAISMYASTAIKLLHPETLAELRTIKAPKNSYGHVYLSKDGKTVFAFVRGDNGLDQYEGRNSLWAWDSETGEGRQVFKGEDHELILRDCAVAPDGSFALFEIERGKGRYQLVSVDVTTGSILGRFGDDEHWATSPAISPDGTRAAATYGSGVVVWDPRSFQLILKCQDSARAQYLKFSADGSRLYGLERGQMVQAWDAVSGDRISRGETVISSHADEVQRAEFTPDGKRAVSIDRKGRLIAWNVTDGSPCGAVEDTARLSDFDVVDNNSFATVDLSGAVALWRINGCEQIRKLTNSPVGAIQRVEYAAGPNRLFCFTGRELVVWDVASGDVLYNFELKIEARLLPNLFVVDDAGRVAIGDRDNGIWTVDLATETARRVYQADDERNRIYDLSFGPDGLLWYCQSSYSSQLFAVDFSEGTLTRTLEFTRNEGDGPPAESPYMFINFAVSENADHAFAYARNRDGYKVMWLNLETSTIESRFMMRSGRVTSVAVTPDGTLGIACGQEKVLRGWTLQD